VTCALLLASFITRVVCITAHAFARVKLEYVTTQPAQGLITQLEECCRETSIYFSTRYYIYISNDFCERLCEVKLNSLHLIMHHTIKS